jgi:hypothetical protein
MNVTVTVTLNGRQFASFECTQAHANQLITAFSDLDRGGVRIEVRS